MSDIPDQITDISVPWVGFQERCNYIAAIAVDRLQDTLCFCSDEKLKGVDGEHVGQIVYEFAEWLDKSCILDDMIWEQFVEYTKHKE